LTLLENEGRESQGALFKHSDLKLLPTLDENIKCGNSLIGTDFYQDKNLSLFDIDDLRKVNSFDWRSEFATVFKKGGFDFVVGNPPYIFARDEGFSSNDKEYFYAQYSLAQYQLNTYIMFTEKGYQILSDTGRLGFIIPNNWLTIETTSVFREFVLRSGKNKLIVNSYDRIFEDANIDTSILVFSKAGSDNIRAIVLRNSTFSEVAEVDSSVILALKPTILNFEVLGSEKTAALCEKIRKSGTVLSNLYAVKAGIKAYEVTKGNPAQTEKMKNDRVYHSLEKHDSSWIKYLDGVDVARYSLGWSGQFVKYGRNLAAPRNSNLFVGKRILVRQIPSKGRYAIHAALCDEYCVNDLNSMIVKAESSTLSPEFVLAVLNSRLMTFWFLTVFGKMQRKLFPQFKINELSQFPIVDIDFKNSKSVKSYERILALVAELSKTIVAGIGALTNDRKPLEQKATMINRQIDLELCSLYGLVQDEIDLIESE
jgi:TaqI-like C-terminal specificity domain/Eco57I restriction-modification methylase